MNDENRKYIKRFLLVLGGLLSATFLILVPYSLWWLHASGDAALERVVKTQAKGEFALFGSALSQDFAAYKLRLYDAVKPEIAAIGSSRVMQFRGAWFSRPFLNMGGVAGNLAMLRATTNAMLLVHKPKALIIGLDFWWFLPQWEQNPDMAVTLPEDSYAYTLNALKNPWEWLFTGKISLKEFFGPLAGIFGTGFRTDRYGIMAQQTSNGFGPDGSWYYTAEITGQRPAQDYQFADTLSNIRLGIKAFYHANPDQSRPAEAHLDAFCELWCRLKSRGIQIYAFIPPLAEKSLAEMKPEFYPHLYKLREALAARGIDVLDFTSIKTTASSDCEFIDGFHGGEITYARILRRMAEHWPDLVAYVNMQKLDALIREWQGHAFVPDSRITHRLEKDFLGLGCRKKDGQEAEPKNNGK